MDSCSSLWSCWVQQASHRHPQQLLSDGSCRLTHDIWPADKEEEDQDSEMEEAAKEPAPVKVCFGCPTRHDSSILVLPVLRFLT